MTRVFGSGTKVVTAVDRVSFDLAEGEMLALVGVSGSGKSTLISILGGLLPPTSGEVESFGIDLSDCTQAQRAQYRRTVASVVFQEYNLLSMLTALENVALAGEISGLTRAEATAAAVEALRSVELGDLTNRYPGQLSGGQRQRVAIARAIAGSRRLVLADEPTGALDRRTSRDIGNLLRRMADDGITVVIATHDLTLAGLADRSVEMDDGRIDSEPVNAL